MIKSGLGVMLINVGFGNVVSAARVIAVVAPAHHL